MNYTNYQQTRAHMEP